MVTSDRQPASTSPTALPAPSTWTGVPLWALAALLVAGVGAALFTQGLVQRIERTRFEYEVARVEYAIGQRINAYVQVLRGGAGLFDASDEVTWVDWIAYVEALQVDRTFPGIRQMSVVDAVDADDLDAYVAEVRAAELPPGISDPDLIRAFTPRPPPGPIDPVETDLHGVVRFVAPMTVQNQESIGLDMMRDAGRRRSMLDALARGDAVLSPPVSLLRGTGTEVGFIAYLPMADEDGRGGWLSAVFYAESFMAGLLGADADRVDLAIHDPGDEDRLLFSSAGLAEDGTPVDLPDTGGSLVATRTLDVPGRTWTVTYQAGPELVSAVARISPWLVALTGLLAVGLVRVSDRARLSWRRQVTVLREAHDAVRHEATHDPLTGLANRVLFLDRLETALRRAGRRDEPFALAYLDIDDFKPVNDAHGHAVGDALLQAIADRLRATTRAEDTLARLGGDEFALILEQVDDPATTTMRLCEDVAAQLRAAFDLRAVGGPAAVRVGVSIGIAIHPAHGRSAAELISAADSAMYAAKRDGKDRCRMAGS